MYRLNDLRLTIDVDVGLNFLIRNVFPMIYFPFLAKSDNSICILSDHYGNASKINQIF